MAFASLVLGALGVPFLGRVLGAWPLFLGLTALAGLALGLISMGRIRRSQGGLRGRGIALAGTILSGAFLLILGEYWFSERIHSKAYAMAFRCNDNIKHLSLGARIYAMDHQGRLPPGDKWCDALEADTAKYYFRCPGGDPNKRSHYAFNAQLAGIETNKITFLGETVMFFEFEGGWNVSGGPELMLKKPRHRTVNVVFVAPAIIIYPASVRVEI